MSTEIKKFSACVPNCWMNCRLYAHVRDGKLVQTSAAPFPDPSYNRICLRGLSHPQRVNSKDRILHPMKRVGKRGENKFEQISWDEAIHILADNLNKIKEKYGSKAVAFLPWSGSYASINGGMPGAIKRFANIFEGTVIVDGVDFGMPSGMSQVVANMAGGMASLFLGPEPKDLSYAKTIIFWGTNITDSQVHNWHFVLDAVENGAKLICIDPRYSETAAKSHEWVRIRPGSDSILALSMIHVIIEENLIDRDYCIKHTVAPFLVRQDNGLFLRQNDIDGSDNAGYLTMDADSNKLTALETVTNPALLGTFDVTLHDGSKLQVKTALQMLKEEADKYKPAEAERLTLVPADKILEIARIYATNTPSTIYTGFGVDRWDNADQVGRGIATLGVITGQIAKKGASPLGAMGQSAIQFTISDAVMGPWTSPTGTMAELLNFVLLQQAILTGKVDMWEPKDPANPLAGPTGKEPVSKDWPIKGLILTTGNMVSNHAEQKVTIEQMFSEEKLDFICCIDMFMTDTARQADLFLPCTSWFENDDIVGGLHPYVMRMEKAIEPMGESKGDWDIFKLLAQKMGWGEYFKGDSKDQIDGILDVLGNLFGDHKDRILNEFKEKGIARLSDPNALPFADGVFYTRTGRAEFYSEGVATVFPKSMPALQLPVNEGHNPLPHFVPPAEAWIDNPLIKKYPLALSTLHTKWRVHTTFYDVPALREMDPEPVVYLNQKESSKRGLKDGDYVTVFNDRGHCVVRLVVDDSINDGGAAIPKGWQRHQFEEGGYQELTKNHINTVHYGMSFFDALVEVKKWEGK